MTKKQLTLAEQYFLLQEEHPIPYFSRMWKNIIKKRYDKNLTDKVKSIKPDAMGLVKGAAIGATAAGGSYLLYKLIKKLADIKKKAMTPEKKKEIQDKIDKAKEKIKIIKKKEQQKKAKK